MGIIVGAVLTGVILIPAAAYYGKEKYEFGKKQGRIEGITYVTKVLGDNFENLEQHTDYSILYSVKTTDIVLINKSGVKTLAIIQ